jgi:tRNA wybutosine-synthesizing protein 4
MMAHFNKLQTPLGAVEKYPTTSAQVRRFKTLGWQDVSARNLWDLWAASDFLTSEERVSLDAVEPFDEWEEFALFGCHYILLVADNIAGRLRRRIRDLSASSSLSESQIIRAHVIYSENKSLSGNRKFASALPIRNPKGTHDRIGNFAGMGMKSRLASYDIYSTNEILDVTFDFSGSSSPSSRMCHTITDLGDAGALLVGGRNSPDHALADSWMYYKWLKTWERIDDLPEARYRHACVRLSDGSVLISPGRRDARNIGQDFFLWNRQSGWEKVDFAAGEMPTPTYGATFTVFNGLAVSNGAVLGRGLIAGGISEDGVLLLEVWEWELQNSVTHTVRSNGLCNPPLVRGSQLCTLIPLSDPLVLSLTLRMRGPVLFSTKDLIFDDSWASRTGSLELPVLVLA